MNRCKARKAGAMSRSLPSIPVCTGLRLGPKTYRYRYRQGQARCMFSANTGNELRVQTLVVDLCVRCETKLLEIALLNEIPVIFNIIFVF